MKARSPSRAFVFPASNESTTNHQPESTTMAIIMISNYSKKLGLPGYSSHMFSVSIQTELSSKDDVPAETERLYDLLQSNVDSQIQKVGFVPSYDYGIEPAATDGTNPATNGAPGAAALAAALAAAIAAASGPAGLPPNNRANPATNGATPAGSSANLQRGQEWKCSDKQRDLILKLIEEHQLDKHATEALAVERFGKGVRLLNKIEASGLIDELLDTHGGNNGQGGARRRNGSAYQNNGRRPAA